LPCIGFKKNERKRTLTPISEGPDADAAIAAIGDLIARKFEED